MQREQQRERRAAAVSGGSAGRPDALAWWLAAAARTGTLQERMCCLQEGCRPLYLGRAAARRDVSTRVEEHSHCPDAEIARRGHDGVVETAAGREEQPIACSDALTVPCRRPLCKACRRASLRGCWPCIAEPPQTGAGVSTISAVQINACGEPSIFYAGYNRSRAGGAAARRPAHRSGAVHFACAGRIILALAHMCWRDDVGGASHPWWHDDAGGTASRPLSRRMMPPSWRAPLGGGSQLAASAACARCSAALQIACICFRAGDRVGEAPQRPW